MMLGLALYGFMLIIVSGKWSSQMRLGMCKFPSAHITGIVCMSVFYVVMYLFFFLSISKLLYMLVFLVTNSSM